MLRMALEFDNRLKYVGNHIDMWEMAKICRKWFRYLANGLINWENDLKIWEMAKIFGKLLRYMGNGLSI